MHILFYDVVSPVIYTHLSLQQTGLGGTESTITRVAHALSAGHTVYVAQRGRSLEEEMVSEGVHYISLSTADLLKPDVVILLRNHAYLKKVGEQFSGARLYFWLHNMPSKKLYPLRKTLICYRYEIIVVSHFHYQAVQRRLAGPWYKRMMYPHYVDAQIPVHVLYNPIEEDLNPNGETWNPMQMMVTSTPYKGLALILEMFENVRRYFPEYELRIATYAPWSAHHLPKRAYFLGSLSHPELMRELRQSFCVFYPQYKRCETFGLIYAEANAVGTPVLAHDFGAAKEVLTNPVAQLVNGRNKKQVIEKIRSWREHRPVVGPNPALRLSRVMQAWQALLEGKMLVK